MIRIGTRKSILAVAQAEEISNQIERKLGLESEIIKITSLGDQDLISQLSSFRGQGVFTSSLERALAAGQIDVAIHSLKDLPVNVQDKLPIIAYYQRHSPGDSLIIKSDLVKSTDPLQLKEGIRVATGSPRRQSQFLDRFPTAVPVDIRGNVQTRLSRLQTSFIDALIMASAVFDRIDVPIPEGLTKIDLDPAIYCPAPGQASIAVQVRAGEFPELSILNDDVTEQCVTTERQILELMGGGCELSLGAYIRKYQGRWHLYTSFTDDLWVANDMLQLTRYHFYADTPGELKAEFLHYFKQVTAEEPSDLLRGKIVVLARDTLDSDAYYKALSRHGATVLSQPILSYQHYWHLLKDDSLLGPWEEAEWIVLSSQRAVPILDSLHQLHPQSKRYAVVGRKTAAVMRRYGFPVHLVATGSMDSLSDELSNALEIYPGKVLYLSGENISKPLVLDHHRVVVYKAETQSFQLGLICDYIVVFSSRSGQAIIEQMGPDIAERWVTIGPTTKQTLSAFSIELIQATNPSPEGVLAAILEDLQ